MDKQKQIEEMAEIALKNTLSYTCAKQIAMNFYNAGYRKIPENAVVLTREEYELFDSVKKGFPNDTSWLAEKYSEIGQTARNRTAEMFAEMAKELLDKQEKGWSANMIWIITAKNCIDEICKEITEGN